MIILGLSSAINRYAAIGFISIIGLILLVTAYLFIKSIIDQKKYSTSALPFIPEIEEEEPDEEDTEDEDDLPSAFDLDEIDDLPSFNLESSEDRGEDELPDYDEAPVVASPSPSRINKISKVSENSFSNPFENKLKSNNVQSTERENLSTYEESLKNKREGNKEQKDNRTDEEDFISSLFG
jgi:hypothetical protein